MVEQKVVGIKLDSQIGEELTEASKSAQARDLFYKGYIPESLDMLRNEISQLESSLGVAGAETEGKTSAEIVPLRILLVKLLLKTGMLSEGREILSNKILAQAELPILLKAKALYISGKLGFYENAYA